MPTVNPSLVEIRDEGTSQGRVTAINFTGAGVVASVSANLATVTIPGGGAGSVTATTVEVNLGSTAVWRGRFTITDATIGATSKLLVWQAPGPYTGKGTRADEAEIQPVSIIAVNPATGSAVVYWQTPPIVTHRLLAQSQFLTSGATVLNSPKDPQGVVAGNVFRIHKVRGNVKFSYIVLA
jgi:hypothetical protein